MREIMNTNFKFWRHLVNFWSILFMIAIIYDFFMDNAYLEIISVLSVVYVSVLAIYVGNKEFERWYDHHRNKHPGEVFVIIWTALIFLLLTSSFVWKTEYRLPGSVLSAYIAVLTILAITNKSKSLYKSRQGRKNK